MIGETAVLVAALGNSARLPALRDLGLKALIANTRKYDWRLASIPSVTFERLADIFDERDDDDLADLRKTVGFLLEDEIISLVGHRAHITETLTGMPFFITVLRLGNLNPKTHNRLLNIVLRHVGRLCTLP